MTDTLKTTRGPAPAGFWAALVGALALAAPLGCAPPPKTTPTPTDGSVTSAPSAGAAPLGAGDPADPPKTPAPAAPDKWAGLDVGSRGVKPIVLSFAKTADGWDFAADTSLDSKNTELGTLAEGNDGFDPKRRDATLAAITELDKAIRDKHALPPERVKVVFSSGVFTRFKDKEKAAKARQELTELVKKAIGREPDFITEEQEAQLAVRAIIPQSGRAGRMLIDIGSGNTKFGWFTDAKFETFTLDSGTKAFRDASAKQAEAKKQPFADAAAALKDTELVAPLREKIGKAAGFDKVTDVQMVGGAAWALTTLTHPGTTDQARVPLSAADVETYAALARMKPDEIRAKVLGGVTEAAAKQAAQKEIDRLLKVFTPEDLIAAGEILRAAFAEGKLGSKKVSFYQRGQHAWIAGYLMAAAKLPE